MSIILAAGGAASGGGSNTPYLALVITGLLAAIPSFLLYLRGGKDKRVDTETKEKADNALAQSTMTQQAFDGLKSQADAASRQAEAASAGHAKCEQRCDELAQDLTEARAELAGVRRELVDALANHAADIRRAEAAERQLAEALRRIESLEQEIETLKGPTP